VLTTLVPVVQLLLQAPNLAPEHVDFILVLIVTTIGSGDFSSRNV
jgi:hypothetical protein